MSGSEAIRSSPASCRTLVSGVICTCAPSYTTGEECAAAGACYEPTRVIAFSLAIHVFVCRRTLAFAHSVLGYSSLCFISALGRSVRSAHSSMATSSTLPACMLYADALGMMWHDLACCHVHLVVGARLSKVHDGVLIWIASFGIYFDSSS